MLPDVEILQEPPKELLDDIRNSNAIFYLGSSFLNPPRYNYIGDILKYLRTEESYNILEQTGGQRGNVANFGRNKFSELKNYVEQIWSSSSYKDLVSLLNKFRNIHTILTTIFDKQISHALKRIDSKVVEITGIESTSEFKSELPKEELMLYQLLGTIRKPDTLYLSDEKMYELREIFRTSPGGKFLKSLIGNKSLLLLGYESSDMFDIFFRGLIKDITYWSDTQSLFPNEIYFINRLEYDTSYGIWGNRDENQNKIIELSPHEFITRLLKE